MNLLKYYTKRLHKNPEFHIRIHTSVKPSKTFILFFIELR